MSVWLPLLRGLTETIPGWGVWKNVDAALEGDGDIDSTAPRGDWPAIEEQFLAWAAAEGLGPAAACSHIPGGFNLIALRGSDPFLELGIKDRRIYRGSTLFRPGDLTGLFEIDPRGFRKIRPGAEGMLKMCLNGSRWGGRRNAEGLAGKKVAELMRADPEGVEQAAGLFGAARRQALAAAHAVMDGRWDQAAMLAVEARAAGLALASPGVLAARLRFRLSGRRRCPIVKSILDHDRAIPGDPQAWLAQVARDHRIRLSEPAP